MSNTRSEIMSLASELIRSVGYNAFSYADISKQLNIKNAAIHYYFPSKSDLGVAIIKAHRDAFMEKTNLWKSLPYRQQFVSYITMHDDFVRNYRMCVVGSLSTSYDTLPENMQHELQNLVNTIIDWLTSLLTQGKECKEFTFSETPASKAYIIHSALLSSLLMNKVLRNDVYQLIQDDLLII